MVLVHHTGRKSGTERINPMMYLPGDTADSLYVFASKAGAPTSPDWYYNLVASGTGSVEVGTDSYPVTVEELQGEERDEVCHLRRRCLRLPPPGWASLFHAFDHGIWNDAVRSTLAIAKSGRWIAFPWKKLLVCPFRGKCILYLCPR